MLWSEIPAPAIADEDLLGRVVHGSRRLVWAEANPDAQIGLVPDNPGLRERAGVPDVCPTRATLQRALWTADIPVNDALVLFFFKCRPQAPYSREDAYRIYRPMLARQIRDSRVTTWIGLGNVVAAGLLGPDAHVKDLRGQVIPREDRPLTLSYHPLAAHRRPNLFPLLAADLCAAACP